MRSEDFLDEVDSKLHPHDWSAYTRTQLTDLYCAIISNPGEMFTLCGEVLSHQDISSIRYFLNLEDEVGWTNKTFKKHTGRDMLSRNEFCKVFDCSIKEAECLEYLYERSEIYCMKSRKYGLKGGGQYHYEMVNLFCDDHYRWVTRKGKEVMVERVIDGGYAIHETGVLVGRSAIYLAVDGQSAIIFPYAGIEVLKKNVAPVWFYMGSELVSSSREEVMLITESIIRPVRYVADVSVNYIVSRFSPEEMNGRKVVPQDRVRSNDSTLMDTITVIGREDTSAMYLSALYTGYNGDFSRVVARIEPGTTVFTCKKLIYHWKKRAYYVNIVGDSCELGFETFMREVYGAKFEQVYVSEIMTRLSNIPIIGDAVKLLFSKSLAYKADNDYTLVASDSRMIVKITVKDVPGGSDEECMFQARLGKSRLSLSEKLGMGNSEPRAIVFTPDEDWRTTEDIIANSDGIDPVGDNWRSFKFKRIPMPILKVVGDMELNPSYPINFDSIRELRPPPNILEKAMNHEFGHLFYGSASLFFDVFWNVPKKESDLVKRMDDDILSALDHEEKRSDENESEVSTRKSENNGCVHEYCAGNNEKLRSNGHTHENYNSSRNYEYYSDSAGGRAYDRFIDECVRLECDPEVRERVIGTWNMLKARRRGT